MDGRMVKLDGWIGLWVNCPRMLRALALGHRVARSCILESDENYGPIEILGKTQCKWCRS
jgi:hypothetical protein